MDGMATMKLYSPENVQAMFPENHRPSLKRVIAKAKEAGCCCKLGRGIGFTPDQVQTFFEYISRSSAPRNTPTQGCVKSGGGRPGSSYLRTRELLLEAKPKK